MMIVCVVYVIIEVPQIPMTLHSVASPSKFACVSTVQWSAPSTDECTLPRTPYVCLKLTDSPTSLCATTICTEMFMRTCICVYIYIYKIYICLCVCVRAYQCVSVRLCIYRWDAAIVGCRYREYVAKQRAL